ncbi:MAG: carbohydrate-binding protein, partial [Bryobacteraceae bacterium]
MKRASLLALSFLGALLLILSAVGTAAVNCSGVTAWAAGGSYTVGELVTYQGSEYKCLQANSNAASNWDPVDWPAGWSLVGTCSGGG